MKTDTQQKKNKNTTPGSSNGYFAWVIKNAIALVAVAFLLQHFVFGEQTGQPGYQWAIHKALRQNSEVIQQIKMQTPGTLNDRFLVKLGASYNYLSAIKANTPEDAVILLPGRKAFFPEGVQSVFQGQEPYNKLWATRFLYPRRVVIPQELGETPWSEKITHVAIVYGQGYEYLNYEVSPRQQFAVYPTHPQNQ